MPDARILVARSSYVLRFLANVQALFEKPAFLAKLRELDGLSPADRRLHFALTFTVTELESEKRGLAPIADADRAAILDGLEILYARAKERPCPR